MERASLINMYEGTIPCGKMEGKIRFKGEKVFIGLEASVRWVTREREKSKILVTFLIKYGPLSNTHVKLALSHRWTNLIAALSQVVVN